MYIDIHYCLFHYTSLLLPQKQAFGNSVPSLLLFVHWVDRTMFFIAHVVLLCECLYVWALESSLSLTRVRSWRIICYFSRRKCADGTFLWSSQIHKHPVIHLITFSQHSICLICYSSARVHSFFCCSLSHLPLCLPFFSTTCVIVSLCFCPQDQTSQSADPSWTNPSRSPLCRAANTPLQAPHAPLLQTPDSELQAGPVLVE